jgi:hypothetical protein
MPIHFEDLDVASDVAGLRSALIVPCNLCPAVTVATRENRPFMRFSRSPLKSPPFEDYLARLQSKLSERGVRTEVFRSNLYHQWFMCMWTSRRRKKLANAAKHHDAVIVLGCDSATETVRGAVPPDVEVLEGMKVAGIMNGRMSLRRSGSLFFDDCRVVPISPKNVA